MAQQIVLPIKDSNVLKMVQDTLLDSFCSYTKKMDYFYQSIDYMRLEIE